MKKIMMIALFVCIMLPGQGDAASTHAMPSSSLTASEAADSSQRLVLTLLAPEIQEQLNVYYKSRLTTAPIFAPFLEGAGLAFTYYPSHIEVQVTVIPYIGPHLAVGKDIIRFRIENSGSVNAISYEHVEDYELPSNWRK